MGSRDLQVAKFVRSNLTLTRSHISPGFSGFLCFLRSVMCAFQRTHVCSTDYDIYVTCHLMFHQILVVVADVEPVFNDHSITDDTRMNGKSRN
jgi:hypothetical protein